MLSISYIYTYDKLETALMNCQPLSPSLSQATISNAIFNCTQKPAKSRKSYVPFQLFFIFTKKLKLHFAHQEQTNKNPS